MINFPCSNSSPALCWLQGEVPSSQPGGWGPWNSVPVYSSCCVSHNCHRTQQQRTTAYGTRPPPTTAASYSCPAFASSVCLGSNAFPPSLCLATSIHPLTVDSGCPSPGSRAFSDIWSPHFGSPLPAKQCPIQITVVSHRMQYSIYLWYFSFLVSGFQLDWELHEVRVQILCIFGLTHIKRPVCWLKEHQCLFYTSVHRPWQRCTNKIVYGIS